MGFCDLVKVMRASFGFMVQLVCMYAMSFNVPLISSHLNTKGYSPMFTGFSMAPVSIAYMISMPLVFKMVECMSRRGVIFIGLVLLVNGILITGMD